MQQQDSSYILAFTSNRSYFDRGVDHLKKSRTYLEKVMKKSQKVKKKVQQKIQKKSKSHEQKSQKSKEKSKKVIVEIKKVSYAYFQLIYPSILIKKGQFQKDLSILK